MDGPLSDPLLWKIIIIMIISLFPALPRTCDDASDGWLQCEGLAVGCERHIGSLEDGSPLDMKESTGIVICFECFRFKFENFTKVTIWDQIIIVPLNPIPSREKITWSNAMYCLSNLLSHFFVFFVSSKPSWNLPKRVGQYIKSLFAASRQAKACVRPIISSPEYESFLDIMTLWGKIKYKLAVCCLDLIWFVCNAQVFFWWNESWMRRDFLLLVL